MIFDSLFHMIFLRTNFMAGINHVINIMSKKQNGGFFDQQFALGIVANFSFRISPIFCVDILIFPCYKETNHASL